MKIPRVCTNVGNSCYQSLRYVLLYPLLIKNRQCTYDVTEARSCNHCCSGEAISIIYSACVFVVLISQHPACAILSPVACPALQYFSTLSHKRYDFWKIKTLTEHKICDLIFSTHFVWTISHSKKKLARYDFRENIRISNVMKIRPVHADRQTDMTKLTVAFTILHTRLNIKTERSRMLHALLLTYSMVQSPSWEANWFAASQDFPRISRNPKVHYRTHKRPPTVSILGQANPVHIPTSYLLEIHPNIIINDSKFTSQPKNSLRFLQLFLMISLLFLSLREMLQLILHRWVYVKSLENWLQILLITSTSLSSSCVVDSGALKLQS